MARRIEVNATADDYRAYAALCKSGKVAPHPRQVAAKVFAAGIKALSADRVTLEASDVVALETPSTAAAPRTRRRKKTRTDSSAPRTESRSTEPAPDSEDM